MSKFDLPKIKKLIKNLNFDAWLLYDFRGSNDLALDILDVPKNSHLTRRFYYLIPVKGTPVKIVNAIEAGHLDHLPGKKLIYSNHQSLTNHLKNSLKNLKTISMEYSPLNAIPYVSKVDAGTIEQIKSSGVKVKSSADLISSFTAVWSSVQLKDNKPVAAALVKIVKDSFNYIKNNILGGITLTEFDIQQFVMNEFEKRNYETDHPPIVGVNENSANPHYSPEKNNSKRIKRGDFVLIDLWAKVKKSSSVWSDITWVGYAGEKIPKKYIDIFNIVSKGRDSAFNLIEKRFNNKKEIRGYEVDDACRKVINDAGYGKYFIHRTGHSITTELHGSGAHMDNYETKDERLLLPSTSFSIEPGIYFKNDFGIRSEIDVYITKNGKVISTGEKQKEIIPILA